jgi:hypothetical protein
MKAICSSETSIDFQRTTRRYIPEDSTLHNHYCKNLKSYMTLCVSYEVGTELLFFSSVFSQSMRCFPSSKSILQVSHEALPI